jgi:hypothetical protein
MWLGAAWQNALEDTLLIFVTRGPIAGEHLLFSKPHGFVLEPLT